jgi:cell division septation protein DedD
MMRARRPGRPHHEFRFGRRELVVLGAVFCLITTLVFAAGVVVGRDMARKGASRADVGREHRSPEPDNLRGAEAPVKTAATRAEEKVTFYRTLTAPTQDVPQVGKPTIEERLVTKGEPAPHVVPDTAPEASPAAPEARTAPERRASKPPEPAPAARPSRPARVSAAQPVRPAPPQITAATATGGPDAWTVQVNAFRSRALAEELRARLAARGYDAYVFPSLTEDGRPRYRVRVGTYAARSDAERAAGDLRTERGLNPLVTPRTR